MKTPPRWTRRPPAHTLAGPSFLPDVALAEQLLEFLVQPLGVEDAGARRDDVLGSLACDDVDADLAVPGMVEQESFELLHLLTGAHPDAERWAGRDAVWAPAICGPARRPPAVPVPSVLRDRDTPATVGVGCLARGRADGGIRRRRQRENLLAEQLGRLLLDVDPPSQEHHRIPFERVALLLVDPGKHDHLDAAGQILQGQEGHRGPGAGDGPLHAADEAAHHHFPAV